MRPECFSVELKCSDFPVLPRAKESMYHALGYSTIVVLQAVMTFEQQDIQNGISAMKDALQTCQKYELNN